MPGDNTLVLFKLQPKQAGGNGKTGINDPAKLQMRLDFIIVECVALGFELLGKMAPVPRSTRQ